MQQAIGTAAREASELATDRKAIHYGKMSGVAAAAARARGSFRRRYVGQDVARITTAFDRRTTTAPGGTAAAV